MLKKLLPKQDNFFELFQEAAQHLVSAAEQFLLLMQNLNKAEQFSSLIAEHELNADNCARTTFDLLHKTFITPFDRYDVLQLTRKLDDILDVINRTARRIALYKIETLPADMQSIAQLGLNASLAIRTALKELESLKNAPDIIELCRSITEANNRAEQIMLEGVGKLFTQAIDYKELLKTKEIYEYSTQIMQECHDLADIIKGIVLEYS